MVGIATLAIYPAEANSAFVVDGSQTQRNTVARQRLNIDHGILVIAEIVVSRRQGRESEIAVAAAIPPPVEMEHVAVVVAVTNEGVSTRTAACIKNGS